MPMHMTVQIVSYLRVGSIAIGAYDFLITIPAEWRFYKGQQRIGRLSLSCTLFILIRYISIIAVVISNVGWFGSFTAQSCSRFFLISPILKVSQAMVSQAILGVRTFNLSQRSAVVGWTLVVLYTFVITLEWLANTYARIPWFDGSGNCLAKSRTPKFGAWVHYACSMLFDFVVTVMSLRYLLQYKFSSTTSVISRVTKIMLYDGLAYFVLLTASNILNLILYQTDQKTQSAGASIGYIIVWIMSQRLLIHLNEANIKRRHDNDVTTISKTTPSSLDISRAIRSQFDTNKNTEWTEPNLESTSVAERGEHIDVHVRFEQTMEVEVVDPTQEGEDLDMRSRGRVSSTWNSAGTMSNHTHDTWGRRVPRRVIAPDPRGPREPMMQTRRL